jgi:predicted PurR-regulated permease PerM
MRDSSRRGMTNIAISTGTIFRVLFVCAVVWLAFAIRNVILLVIGALFLAVLMEPFADALERRRIPRSIAAIVVYGTAFFAISGLLYVVLPPALAEFGNIIPVFAPYLEHATGGSWAGSFHEDWFTSITSIIATLRGAGISAALPQVFGVGSSAIGVITAVVVLMILGFYFVAEKQAIVSSISRIAPAEYHPFINQLATKLRDRLGAWLRGQLMLMGVIFLLTYIALSLIGVPYALILALLAGALEVIPFIGPLLSAVPAVMLALVLSPVHAAVVVGAYLLIQIVEGQVLVPKIMQHATGMNPLLSLLAVLIGWTLGGIPGAILAIPFANAAMVFAEEIKIL